MLCEPSPHTSKDFTISPAYSKKRDQSIGKLNTLEDSGSNAFTNVTRQPMSDHNTELRDSLKMNILRH